MLHAKRACGSTWRKPRGDWKEKKVPPRSLPNMKGPIGGGPTEECGEGTVMGHPCWSIYLFFFLGYGRCRTVARSLHEHKLSKVHLYKDTEGP